MILVKKLKMSLNLITQLRSLSKAVHSIDDDAAASAALDEYFIVKLRNCSPPPHHFLQPPLCLKHLKQKHHGSK